MRFYDRAKFLLCPSISEGLPTVILESFSRGLPVIATDVGAIPVALSDSTGLLIENRGRALREALEWATSISKGDYEKLRTNCRDKAHLSFSEKQVAGHLLHILGEAVQN